MKEDPDHIVSFDLPPGRAIGEGYVVESKLGQGWEGEVYKVIERRTGARRAAKIFFPRRNPDERALTFYAQKLERLASCRIVIQYHHSEVLRFRSHRIPCMISEFVEGEVLRDFIGRQPEGRLQPFEAMHLLHALAAGLEEIHAKHDYHGDLHDRNVLVSRRGVHFDVRVIDFFHWGRCTRSHLREDVADLVRLLYDAVGGRAAYGDQPPEIRTICRGLRRDLIDRAFPTARALREHLDSFTWTEPRRRRSRARPRRR